MSSSIHGTQANEMSHFSKTRTLSDFPLLIGEILRRADLRLQRQARRRARVRKIKATFGIPQIKADEEFFLDVRKTPI
jgi:hypothetical protein